MHILLAPIFSSYYMNSWVLTTYRCTASFEIEWGDFWPVLFLSACLVLGRELEERSGKKRSQYEKNIMLQLSQAIRTLTRNCSFPSKFLKVQSVRKRAQKGRGEKLLPCSNLVECLVSDRSGVTSVAAGHRRSADNARSPTIGITQVSRLPTFVHVRQSANLVFYVHWNQDSRTQGFKRMHTRSSSSQGNQALQTWSDSEVAREGSPDLGSPDRPQK